MKCCLALILFLCAGYERTLAQLEHVPPILAEIRDSQNLNGILLLNTSDYHHQYGAPNHYPSTLQIIDPLNPWPPIFFINAKPGGKGALGNGYYTNFFFHENSRLLSFYGSISTSNSPYGTFVISDTNFIILDTVAKNTRNADSHDFQINSKGERLYMTVVDSLLNLSAFSNNPVDTSVLVTSQMIQVIDKAGKVVFHWNPLEHLSISESYKKYKDLTDNNPFTRGWDWQHGNSAGFTDDGNIIYSFRFLGVGKINRQTGKIMWKFGGKSPTIPVPAGGEYYLQHDFQEIAPNVYSLFSNGNKKSNSHKNSQPCRALVYYIDENRLSAKTLRIYEPDTTVFSISLGNYQTDENSELCVLNYGKYTNLQERQRSFEIVDTSGVVHATYTSPLLNFSYRAQYVRSWKPTRPVIFNESGTLKVTGFPYRVSWYLLDGLKLTHVSDELRYQPKSNGTYIATMRAGFGWLVSKPYVF